MGAAINWIKENNGIFNERWRGWEDNNENSSSLCGNYLNLGYGGNDHGACFCFVGFNHIEAYGDGNKDLSAGNALGANLITYSDVFGNHAEWVTMRTFTAFGANVMISHGAHNTVMSGIGIGGVNYAEVCGGNADITLIMVIGNNSAHVIGDGNAVMTGINFIGVNELLKVGNGNNVMTAFNTLGLNVLTHIGDGSNIMTAINLLGINSMVSIGRGLNVMNAFNTLGLNFLLRVGDGDNFMLAATFFGANVLTQLGNGLNVMTAFNTAGANILTHIGNGTNVMTAVNVLGVNTLFKQGEGDSYMTAITAVGLNILTKLGDGINVMTAINIGGLNSLVNVGRGLNVMTALNYIGVNFLLKIGEGDSYMTAVNVIGDNTLIKLGDGINVMTAINLVGINSLLNTGNGLNVMTAFNVIGANILLKIGDGVSVMTGGNLYGLNVLTRIGNGVNIMTAGNQYGINVLTRIGNDLNVMTAFNQNGLNALTSVGDGVNIMTAFNQYGVNVLTRVGNDLNVMTAFNQQGLNVLTNVGNGINIMTALNQNGNNVLTRVGNDLNVMTAFNEEGFNILTNVGDGISIMTAGNQQGENILTRVGNDLNVMTALNAQGINLLTAIGNGSSIMTAFVGTGGNVLTRVGDGLTVMIAFVIKDGINTMASVGDGIRVQVALNLADEKANVSSNFIVNVRNHDEGQANWRDGAINSQVALASQTNIIANYGAYHRGDAADLIIAFSLSRNFQPNVDFNNIGPSVAAAFNKNHDAIGDKLNPTTYAVKSPFEGLLGDKTTSYEKRPGFWNSVPDDKKREVGGDKPWQVDSSGYVNSGLKNFFGIQDKYADLLSEDSLRNALQSLKDTNLIMAGYGSDVVVAYAQRNIILADSWPSILDFDIRMIQGGGESSLLFTSNQLMEVFGKSANLGMVRDVAKFADMALPYLNFSKYTGTIPEIVNYRYNEETSQFDYIRDSGRHSGESASSPITSGEDIENFVTSKISLRWDTAIYPQMVQQFGNCGHVACFAKPLCRHGTVRKSQSRLQQRHWQHCRHAGAQPQALQQQPIRLTWWRVSNQLFVVSS